MDQKVITITVNGISLDIAAAFRAASTELVFFIHGLGCSKESFKDVWHQPGFWQLSLLAIDLAGFGASARPDQFSYSMEDHARVCEEVLKGFQYDRIHIVAHSMGGAVGLLLSDDVLEKAVSFSNIEGNLIGEDCGLVSREVAGVPYDVFENELLPNYRLFFKGLEKKGVSLDTAYAPAFYRSSESLVAWSDSRKLLERFNSLMCKKIFFYGEQSPGIEALKELTEIKTEAISRSGHFVMNDNPAEFYMKLQKILQE